MMPIISSVSIDLEENNEQNPDIAKQIHHPIKFVNAGTDVFNDIDLCELWSLYIKATDRIVHHMKHAIRMMVSTISNRSCFVDMTPSRVMLRGLVRTN